MLATVLTKTILDRWKGVAIGSVSIGLLLLMGMSVYRDIDLSIYTSMPEVFRSLMNIPLDASVGTLAYGAIYLSYGALTLAALSLSMGSASIAREERNGTMGLLLGNPKSRRHVLVSKAGSILLLTGAGALILWAAGVLTPAVLNVEIGDMHVGALAFHIFVISLFHGFLAMAIGAWTGKAGMASGISAGIMVLSFIAVGIFPLIKGWEGLAKAFPWYYYQNGDPALNGVDWPSIGILLGGIVLLGILAVVGLNRRDLRDKTDGRSLVDRLREYPLTKKLMDRLAGSARVSHIWIKTLSEYQVLLIVVAYMMFLIMGVVIGPVYKLIDDALKTASNAFPDALLALFGGGDIGTPEGFYQIETFGMMAPVAVMVVTVAIGAKALAGEEANRTMGLLLANPIKRSKIVAQKAFTMVAAAVVVGFSTLAGVILGSVLGGLGMDWGNIAATCLLVTLVGLVFGALALALSAATGRVRVSIFAAIGVALVLFIMNALLPFSESLAGLAKVSPFYYYLTSDPLLNGMHWGHGAVLTAVIVVLLAAAFVLFDKRDLRQTG